MRVHLFIDDFNDLNKLITTIEEDRLPMNIITAFYYDSKNKDVINITKTFSSS